MRVEEPDPPEERVTLVGLREAVKPEGVTDEDSDTVPEKLFRLERLIVDEPWEPDWMVRLEGLLEMLKSAEELATVTVLDATPTAPLASVTERWTL